jgi:hypothetical protein
MRRVQGQITKPSFGMGSEPWVPELRGGLLRFLAGRTFAVLKLSAG